MQLSVIIPAYNAAATLPAQLEALARETWTEPWEVIVADNGSTDNTRSVVEQYQQKLPNLRLVDASDWPGAAHARNVGAAAALGPALAFCDADDEIGAGWVAAIGAALKQYDFVASRFDTEKLNPLWVRRSHTNPQKEGLKEYRFPPYLPHAGGSGLGIKLAIHNLVGGFDESMRILEDTDYCWRVQRAGIRLGFVPEAVVHVRYRDTLRGIFKQARRYAEYNVLLYKKYRLLGMPSLSWRDELSSWGLFFKRLPRVRSKGGLAALVWLFAWRLGRLYGYIKYRNVSQSPAGTHGGGYVLHR